MRIKLASRDTVYAWYPVYLEDKNCIAIFERVKYVHTQAWGTRYYSLEYKMKQPKPPKSGSILDEHTS